MMQAFETWLARVLILNSGLTFGVCLGWLGAPQGSGELPWLYAAALLGLVSGLLALRGKPAGWCGSLLYYGVQLVSYYPLGAGTPWSLKAGLSLGVVLTFPSAIVVLNLLALLLWALSAALLWRSLRQRPL